MEARLKILLTNFRLAERTGSECVIADLARGLRERGHMVAVYTPEIGRLGEQLRDQEGFPVVATPEDAPFMPDVIHGQQLIPTTLALLAFPAVPVLYNCHGYGPLEERPPVHPRVLRWLAPSPRFRGWFAKEFGIPEQQFVLAPNFVDETRFRPPVAGRALDGARRALLYHTNLRRGVEWEALRSGCAAAGWTFEAVGAAFGGGTDAPETLLPQFDVVFTSGRSALEALACGCQVMIVGPGRISPILAPETFDEALAVNFASVPAHGELTAPAVTSLLEGMAGHEESTLSPRVREQHSQAGALNRLEGCYHEMLKEGVPAPDPVTDQQALHAALQTASAALVQNRQETARLRAGWEETKRKREAAVKELREIKLQRQGETPGRSRGFRQLMRLLRAGKPQ